MSAHVLYDYAARDETQISLRAGGHISVTPCEGEWWRGVGSCGREGWFPAQYVALTANPVLPPPPPPFALRPLPVNGGVLTPPEVFEDGPYDGVVFSAGTSEPYHAALADVTYRRSAQAYAELVQERCVVDNYDAMAHTLEDDTRCTDLRDIDVPLRQGRDLCALAFQQFVEGKPFCLQ